MSENTTIPAGLRPRNDRSGAKVAIGFHFANHRSALDPGDFGSKMVAFMGRQMEGKDRQPMFFINS